METFTFPTFPVYANPVHFALFNNVSNASELRRKLIGASQMTGEEGDKARQEVDYGFIDGSLIVSRQHLINALFSTVLTTLPADSSSPPQTRTHNLHSEILLGLSINTNITDAIRRHGISDDSKCVIIVRIGGTQPSDEVWKGMRDLVEGDIGSLAELVEGKAVDWSRVDKVYKVAEMNQLKDPDLLQKKIAAVESAVAIKSVT